MNSRLPLILLCALALTAGCADESPVDAPPSAALPDLTDYQTPEIRAIEAEVEALRSFDPTVADAGALARRFGLAHGRAVVVPVGSSDALAAAIDAAGPNGLVRLASGMHSESGTVRIEHPITIVGEAGAVLVVDTQPYPDVLEVDPALYVIDANGPPGRVVIAGLEIRPAGEVGGTAILIEDSARVTVLNNRVFAHQAGVILQHGDHARIIGNTIELEPTIAEHGVTVINGDGVAVAGNSVSGAVFGLWACDEDGYAVGNEFDTSLIGLIYCKVPVGYPLPSGVIAGSENPATGWYGALNRSTQNAWGYMVVDGANNSVLAFNDAADNAFYDVHVVPDTEVLFGFCTPAAFDNTVVTADDADVIKDCGIDTTVIGGTLVDLSVDPCEPPCTGGAKATVDADELRTSLRQAFTRLVD